MEFSWGDKVLVHSGQDKGMKGTFVYGIGKQKNVDGMSIIRNESSEHFIVPTSNMKKQMKEDSVFKVPDLPKRKLRKPK